MNTFCKRFFAAFFAVVLTLMLLLSYGLTVHLQTMAHGAYDRGYTAVGSCQVPSDWV